MKKMVLKVTIQDEKSKRKALKVVTAVEGVDSVAVDMKEKKITVIGEADPVCVTGRLRKFGFGYAELLSVGPAKEDKKEEKKDEKKPETPKVVGGFYGSGQEGKNASVIGDADPISIDERQEIRIGYTDLLSGAHQGGEKEGNDEKKEEKKPETPSSL